MKLRNDGFTLVEVLAVIVILGVLIGIGVSTYSSYLTIGKNKSYNLAQTSMKDSATSAITDCLTGNGKNRDFCKKHDVLSNSYEHEIILLEELIDDDYINAIRDPNNTDRLCNTGTVEENGSYVYIINKTNEDSNNLNLEYKVCLKCGNYSSEDCLGDSLVTDYAYESQCQVTYENGQPYDNVWTDKDLYLTFTVGEGYRYGLQYFEYYIGDKKESRVTAVNGSAKVKLDKSVDNKIIKVTAYDGLGKTATAQCGTESIKIDKSKIIGAKLLGKLKTLGTNVEKLQWVGEDVVLTVVPNPAKIPSGYYYQWYKDGIEIGSKTTSNTYTATMDGTYKVVVINGLNNQNVETNEISLKFDKTIPTISSITNPLSLIDEDYDFLDNVVYTFGISEGNISCNPAFSIKTGSYDVTCTAKGNNGLIAKTTFKVKHTYEPSYKTKYCDVYETHGHRIDRADGCCSDESHGCGKTIGSTCQVMVWKRKPCGSIAYCPIEGTSLGNDGLCYY